MFEGRARGTERGMRGAKGRWGRRATLRRTDTIDVGGLRSASADWNTLTQSQAPGSALLLVSPPPQLTSSAPPVMAVIKPPGDPSCVQDRMGAGTPLLRPVRASLAIPLRPSGVRTGEGRSITSAHWASPTSIYQHTPTRSSPFSPSPRSPPQSLLLPLTLFRYSCWFELK